MYVYIAASFSGVLYVGVTNNLERRMHEHKLKLLPGFTAKYNVSRLMYFETCTDPLDAIAREKQIKGWSRQKKINLIESQNPNWDDLSKDSSLTL
jgi:putative endonuclease